MISPHAHTRTHACLSPKFQFFDWLTLTQSGFRLVATIAFPKLSGVTSGNLDQIKFQTDRELAAQLHLAKQLNGKHDNMAVKLKMQEDQLYDLKEKINLLKSLQLHGSDKTARLLAKLEVSS